MKSKSKIFIFFLLSASIFFSLNTLGIGQANVSRSPNLRSVSPRIAVDSAGNLHVVWAEYYSDTSGDAFYARYNIGTDVWEAPANLSNSRICHSAEYRPVGVAVDGSDNIYVVYVGNSGATHTIRLRIRSSGSWSSPFEVATADDEVDSARIDVDSSGNIFTTWWTINQGAVYSRARIGGSWEAVQRISPAGMRSKFPNIGVGNNAAFCVWNGLNATRYNIAYVRRDKSFNASWSASQFMAPTSSEGQETPDVEVDSSDNAQVVFSAVLAKGGLRAVRYARWTGSGFNAPITLSSSTLLHYPFLHVSGNNVYVCWQVGAWGYGSALRYNNRINGAWTGETSLPNSSGCSYTDVATSPSQNQVYYVWDDIGLNGGTWEVYCNMGETGPPPPPPPPPTGEPVALFSYSPASGSPPLTVTFDGSSSYDQDGTITAYSWNFGDGSSGSGRVVTHTYNSGGSFTARLTVTDNEGKTGSASHTVNVIQTIPNEPPIAEFSFSPNTGIYPLLVTFDASASRDPDGSIVQYSWDFGDGRTGSGRVVTHNYTRGGTFLIRLTVRDNSGGTATRSRTITVLTLQKPLNINWTTHADESLFQTRYVTEVTWERNPANDSLGVQVVLYRIYRKKISESDKAYRVIGEVTGDTYRYMDKDAGGNNIYAYTVSGLDNKGHESPLSGAAGFFSNPLLDKQPKGTERQGQILKF